MVDILRMYRRLIFLECYVYMWYNIGVAQTKERKVSRYDKG